MERRKALRCGRNGVATGLDAATDYQGAPCGAPFPSVVEGRTTAHLGAFAHENDVTWLFDIRIGETNATVQARTC